MQGEPLNVVMLAAEAVPYVKVGGLGDVVGALPKALEKLGVKPTILIPAYKSINHDEFGIRPCEAVPGFSLGMGSGSVHAEVYQARIPYTGIDVFLIGCVDYFYRDGIYDDPVTREGYLDNMERYIFFVRAGLEFLRRLGRRVDILHCHDSQTGLVPGLLQANHREDPFFRGTGSLFTIHNLAYQGIFPRESLYWAGIDYRHFHYASPFEFWGKVNFMKAGIQASDLLNTVSETYAREIQSTAEFGYGLEGVLRARSNDLSGIVNGIDYSEWDPESDPSLPAHFSTRDLSGKVACKAGVLSSFGLPRDGEQVPLVGMVSRLADQKGLDLVAEAMEDLVRQNLRFVFLGRGQQRYHELLSYFAARHPKKVGVKIDFDNALAHNIYAGCDMFLMPSRYEPCGLNQLISLRYGTVPIVRATGGLVDTVEDFSPDTGTGTGFRFMSYSASDMMGAVHRGLTLYSDTTRWSEMVHRAMSQNWSWDESARKYAALYHEIFRRRHLKPGRKGT